MLNNLNSNYNCTWVRFVQKQKQFNYKRQHQFYLIQYSNFMFLCQTWIWLYFNPLCVSVIYLIEWMHCMLYAHCFKRKNLVLLINLPQGHKKWSPQWRSSIQFSLRNSLTIDSNMTPLPHSQRVFIFMSTQTEYDIIEFKRKSRCIQRRETTETDQTPSALPFLGMLLVVDNGPTPYPHLKGEVLPESRPHPSLHEYTILNLTTQPD